MVVIVVVVVVGGGSSSICSRAASSCLVESREVVERYGAVWNSHYGDFSTILIAFVVARRRHV